LTSAIRHECVSRAASLSDDFVGFWSTFAALARYADRGTKTKSLIVNAV
jgi:hypothetical protein